MAEELAQSRVEAAEALAATRGSGLAAAPKEAESEARMSRQRAHTVGIVLFTVGATLLASPALALDVAGWGQALAAPALAGAGVAASGRTLTYGHLELTPEGGRLHPVTVGGRIVGVYLSGGGRMRYVSTDPLEAATYRTNVRRAGTLEVGADGAFVDTFDGALVMLSAGAESLAGEGGWPAGPADADAMAALARHRERFAGDETRRYGQLLPQAMVDPPGAPVVVAEIVGGHDDYVFVLDPMRDHEESIAAMEKPKAVDPLFKDLRFPELLSSQPVGRARLEPRPKPFLLTAVDLTLVNPASLTAELEVIETFTAQSPVKVLALDLWSTRFGTAGAAARLVENPYTLRSVTLASGEALPFSHVNDELLVELPHGLKSGEQATLVFKITGDVLFNPGNDSYWEMPTDAWLPLPRLDLQYLTYHAVVKARKPFVAFSCGRTVRRWEEGEMACAEFREDKPIQIPVVLAGKYTTHSEEQGGVTVRVSSYAMSDPRTMKKLAGNVFALMETYRPFLGAYPFAELNLIEINDYGYGQAPAGVIFITKEAFTPLQDELTRAFSGGINARLAHELAHTWWGHVVKLSTDDAWLSESVAEYFSAYAISKLWRESEFKKAHGEWRAGSRFVKDTGTVYLADQLSGREGYEGRVKLLYAKGPLVLHALRGEIGDDNQFFTILKSYVKNFNFKTAETRHFIGLTNFITKKDYTPFFDRYLLGTEWPKD